MMSFQWSYFVMVLCFCLTSAAFLGYHGNRINIHGDEPSDVNRNGAETPPTDGVPSGRISMAFSNDSICRELCRKGDGGNACLCDWPPLQKEILFSLKQLYKDKPVPLFKFPTPEDEPACKLLCQQEEDGLHFCLCH